MSDLDELIRGLGAVDCDGSLNCPADSHLHGCFAAGPFDSDELVRWAERYGHPEGWAKKAQQLHGENERLRREMAAREGELSVVNLTRLHEENEQLRSALREAIGWSYGDGPTPERRDELERL